MRYPQVQHIYVDNMKVRLDDKLATKTSAENLKIFTGNIRLHIR